MSRAYLTIDDGPTKMTPDFLDYLFSKGIVPVMNFIGEKIEPNFEEALYAIRKGVTIGNHSYSHPAFSKLTMEECRSEIERTEEKINHAYQCAGVERTHRVFRFPYGDKGGANAPLIQKMLREEFQFERIDDSEITYPWWKENHLDTDVDMFWTFDFAEYQLTWNNGFSWNDIEKRILDKNPEQGGALLDENATHIVLFHDIEETAKVLPDYYKKILGYVLERNVEFMKPEFVTCK